MCTILCARNLALLPPWRSYAAGSLYSPEIAYLVNCSRYGSAAAGGRTEVRRQPEPPKGKTSPRHRSDESLSQVSEIKTPEGNRTPDQTILGRALPAELIRQVSHPSNLRANPTLRTPPYKDPADLTAHRQAAWHLLAKYGTAGTYRGQASYCSF